jgi:hypothetical protein
MLWSSTPSLGTCRPGAYRISAHSARRRGSARYATLRRLTSQAEITDLRHSVVSGSEGTHICCTMLANVIQATARVRAREQQCGSSEKNEGLLGFHATQLCIRRILSRMHTAMAETPATRYTAADSSRNMTSSERKRRSEARGRIPLRCLWPCIPPR